MSRAPNNGRFAVCSVGEGYSVEDRRTGERVSYHKTEGAAWRRQRQESKRAKAEAHASRGQWPRDEILDSYDGHGIAPRSAL